MPNNPLLCWIACATFSLGCFVQCRNWSQVFVALGTSRCTFSHQPTHLRSCIQDETAIAEASGSRWHHWEGGLVLHVEASQRKRLCARVAICSSTPGDYRQNRKFHLFNKRCSACQHRISQEGKRINCACPFHSSLLSRVEEKNRFLILDLFCFGEVFKCEFKMDIYFVWWAADALVLFSDIYQTIFRSGWDSLLTCRVEKDFSEADWVCVYMCVS